MNICSILKYRLSMYFAISRALMEANVEGVKFPGSLVKNRA